MEVIGGRGGDMIRGKLRVGEKGERSGTFNEVVVIALANEHVWRAGSEWGYRVAEELSRGVDESRKEVMAIRR